METSSQCEICGAESRKKNMINFFINFVFGLGCGCACSRAKPSRVLTTDRVSTVSDTHTYIPNLVHTIVYAFL